MDSISTPLLPPEPCLEGSGLTIGIAVARYNWAITGAMLEQTRKELLLLKVPPESIKVVYVPGSYELAIVAQAMLQNKSYDALICLGCVMRGETRHDVLVSDAAAQGIQRIALDAQIPVIFGVICAQNQSQAEARIVRGRECARAALEMARIIKLLAMG